MRRRVLSSLILFGALGCGDGGLDPLPLHIAIEASRLTPAPGEAVSFVVSAQGGNLFGIEIDYGDGSADLRATGGARTARVTFHHTYAAAGTYQVSAAVTDAVAGTQTAEVEIRVQ